MTEAAMNMALPTWRQLPPDLHPGTRFYIYIHAKPDGTPFYVGKGCRRRALDFRSNRSKHFLHVVDKHGANNIRVATYPAADEDDAYALEIIFIDLLRWKGYPLINLTDGGDGVRGYRPTPEAIEKTRAANLGRKLSAETRAKMSIAHRGRVFSAERRANISAALTGKKMSPEARAKMSAYWTGRPRGPVSELTRSRLSIAASRRKGTTK